MHDGPVGHGTVLAQRMGGGFRDQEEEDQIHHRQLAAGTSRIKRTRTTTPKYKADPRATSSRSGVSGANMPDQSAGSSSMAQDATRTSAINGGRGMHMRDVCENAEPCSLTPPVTLAVDALRSAPNRMNPQSRGAALRLPCDTGR